MFFSEATILLRVYTLVVGNTLYGKRHISRTEPVLLHSNIRLKLTFTPIFLLRCLISSMHSSTRKTPQKRTLKKSLHLSVNLKNVRVLAPPTLLSIELWRQRQPLILPPIEASDGALRSVKHERRRLQDDQNSGIYLRDANTTRRAFE